MTIGIGGFEPTAEQLAQRENRLYRIEFAKLYRRQNDDELPISDVGCAVETLGLGKGLFSLAGVMECGERIDLAFLVQALVHASEEIAVTIGYSGVGGDHFKLLSEELSRRDIHVCGLGVSDSLARVDVVLLSLFVPSESLDWDAIISLSEAMPVAITAEWLLAGRWTASSLLSAVESGMDSELISRASA